MRVSDLKSVRREDEEPFKADKTAAWREACELLNIISFTLNLVDVS
jgi:hypothetical protein